MIEYIKKYVELLAIIVSPAPLDPGIQFLTPDSFSQQLACMRHPAGKLIDPHVHNQVTRSVHYTQEVLFLRSGKMRVDLYDTSRNYVESRVLGPGDVILLATGGHGFQMLEETEMIEVKQGPYVGDQDKTRFQGVASVEVSADGERG